jgi:hypothetical protein
MAEAMAGVLSFPLGQVQVWSVEGGAGVGVGVGADVAT